MNRAIKQYFTTGTLLLGSAIWLGCTTVTVTIETPAKAEGRVTVLVNASKQVQVPLSAEASGIPGE